MALVSCMAVAADTASGSFAVWAIGLPDGYIIMEHQETVIHVTAEDVARGVVEVRGASRLIVTTHAPSPYALDFLNRNTVFRLIGVDGMWLLDKDVFAGLNRRFHPPLIVMSSYGPVYAKAGIRLNPDSPTFGP